MTADPDDVLPPRILIVDDERQIHASVRLRLGREFETVSCYNPKEALDRIRRERFDLCFTDLHMPHMDGFAFVEQARQVDPALGYVILSAFDSDENLRRAIPLQVLDFIGKPLPEREGFERRLPDWLERARQQRRSLRLADASRTVAQDLATAQLAHEVELVASETARDALLQTANLLTTVHAHLVAATALLGPRVKTDPSISHAVRSIEECRKTADAAVTVTEGFFNSSYASRDSSPAFIDAGIRHAINIAQRFAHAESTNKVVDFAGLDSRLIVRDLSGIELLLTLTPAISAVLTCALPASTVRVHGVEVSRLEVALKDPNCRDFLWLNRKQGLISRPGVQITLTANSRNVTRADIESWLKGSESSLSSVSRRGLVAGLQKCRGMLGCITSTSSTPLRLILLLPT